MTSCEVSLYQVKTSLVFQMCHIDRGSSTLLYEKESNYLLFVQQPFPVHGLSRMCEIVITIHLVGHTTQGRMIIQVSSPI